MRVLQLMPICSEGFGTDLVLLRVSVKTTKILLDRAETQLQLGSTDVFPVHRLISLKTPARENSLVSEYQVV